MEPDQQTPADNTLADYLFEESAVDGEDGFASMQAFRAMEDRRRKLKKRRTTIIVVVVAVVIVVAAVVATVVVSNSLSSLANITAQTTQVEKGDFTDVVSGSGALKPVSSSMVTPEVSGIVESVNVSAGGTVNAGDVLFTLKNDELDTAVAQAQQQVRSAQNAVNAAEVSLQSARDSYDSARSAASSASTVTKASGSSTGTGTGTGTTTFDEGTMQDAIDSAQVALDGANITLQSAQQSYDQAVATAAKRTVTAPASGSIISMNALVGTQVVAGGTVSGTSSSPLVEIADLSQMKVTIQVNELDISKIAVGQKATVSFSALSDVKLDATVLSIASTATTSSTTSLTGTSGGVVTYAVELLIAQPDARLKSGMTANVTVTTQQLSNVLTVPVAAVQEDAEGKYLIARVDDEDSATGYHTENRRVTVTNSSSTSAVVEGDIKAGDTIFLSSPDATTTVTNG